MFCARTCFSYATRGELGHALAQSESILESTVELARAQGSRFVGFRFVAANKLRDPSFSGHGAIFRQQLGGGFFCCMRLPRMQLFNIPVQHKASPKRPSQSAISNGSYSKVIIIASRVAERQSSAM